MSDYYCQNARQSTDYNCNLLGYDQCSDCRKAVEPKLPFYCALVKTGPTCYDMGLEQCSLCESSAKKLSKQHTVPGPKDYKPVNRLNTEEIPSAYNHDYDDYVTLGEILGEALRNVPASYRFNQPVRSKSERRRDKIYNNAIDDAMEAIKGHPIYHDDYDDVLVNAVERLKR